MVSRAAGRGTNPCARYSGWTRRRVRASAMDAIGGNYDGSPILTNSDTVFPAGYGNHFGAQFGRIARCGGRHIVAHQGGRSVCAVGVGRALVATARAWLSNLGGSGAFRSLENLCRRRGVGINWFDELGPAKSSSEFRV